MKRHLSSTPIDDGGEPPDDKGMEARIENLEHQLEGIKEELASIKIDVAVIKANGATKAELAEAKTSIIIWVVSAVFLAQLIPSLVKLVEKYAY